MGYIVSALLGYALAANPAFQDTVKESICDGIQFIEPRAQACEKEQSSSRPW